MAGIDIVIFRVAEKDDWKDNMKKPYKKPKRTFEKSGVVSPDKSYFIPLDNVTNTDS